MNCCDTYGQCTQGRDCPARTGVVLPHQAAHARRVESSDCASEGGNFYPATPEPVQFNVFQSIFIYLMLSTLGLISLGLLAVGGRYLYLQYLQFFN
jgi:hypothetical protein